MSITIQAPMLLFVPGLIMTVMGFLMLQRELTVTLPSSASIQSVYLYWPYISSGLTMGSYTYLRIWVTSASNGMTISNPTGYFSNGETEDYRVTVDTFPLSVQLLSFDAQKTTDQKVNIRWQVAYEQIQTKNELQRSPEMKNWISIETVTLGTNSTAHAFTDKRPLPGISFYRLKIQGPNGTMQL